MRRNNNGGFMRKGRIYFQGWAAKSFREVTTCKGLEEEMR